MQQVESGIAIEESMPPQQQHANSDENAELVHPVLRADRQLQARFQALQGSSVKPAVTREDT